MIVTVATTVTLTDIMVTTTVIAIVKGIGIMIAVIISGIMIAVTTATPADWVYATLDPRLDGCVGKGYPSDAAGLPMH